ncbi:ABC transporter ATP-binding protein [Paenibacillus thermoaerophilus]|uniref:ABC transporter ATP-binding protein n=1 Tax=Paenibacillus thermoaerophilus TaxID=1215385 RepID=A0ABW2V2H0_9BACL|nr:ABC transporter ATP-binding protein [Paenibacillus thermoaerophilus]TMV18832.1 ABC transporter ATP-binding protein [Paenibacillus thermoaerophilus]
MSGPDKRDAGARPIADAAGAPIRPLGGFGGGHPGSRGPVVKPKQFGASLKRLWRYIGGERKLLTAVFLFILINSAITLGTPYLIGIAVDAMSGETVDWSVLRIVLTALAAAYMADGGLAFLQSWLMAGIAQRIVRNMRTALFAKLQRMPLGYFDSKPHGEVMSRLSNDIDNVSQSISQSSAQLMNGTISIVGSLVLMVWLSPVLTLASLITVPLVYSLARGITRRTRVLFKEQQAQLGRLNGHIEETISGLEAVKAFNRESKVIEEFEEVNKKLFEVGLKAQIVSGFLMPMLGVINNIGFAAIAIVGGVLAVRGDISVGVIASFIGYSRQFVRPLNDLANTYNLLQSGIAGAERAFEVLDEAEEPADGETATALVQPEGRVRFDRVGFGYRPDAPILRNVSFEAAPGSRVALVGPTGAGKTTIVNLLTRFYDVSEGAIYLDGRDIRTYTRESLRRCFGIVLQDTYLFSGTIAENIRYGRPEAGEEEVRRAAVLAGADEFIRRLPHGYDTMLSESGGNLSQGQRQLLAIARVILADSPILILDEATSSIDTRTELRIQEALLKLMQGRTCFIIAHRLNTIRDADQILVIDKGGIIEAGTHEQLMRTGGYYSRMFESQFKHAIAGEMGR